MQVANSLWTDRHHSLRPQFLETTRHAYRSEIHAVDLESPGVVGLINGWVSRNTHGLIREISSTPPGANSSLVLLNATYFQGAWARPFQLGPSGSRPFTFTLADGRLRHPPLMVQHGNYRYYQAEDFQAVRLPYVGDRFSLYVFLPAEKVSLGQFLQRLDAAHWNRWLARLEPMDGRVEMPRFKVEFGVDLVDSLKALGMEEAFDRARADFSAVSNDQAWLSEVRQRTLLEVNEKETKAVAVTEVGLQSFGIAKPVKIKPFFVLRVNRPFFVALRDDRAGLLLFLGAIADPQ